MTRKLFDTTCAFILVGAACAMQAAAQTTGTEAADRARINEILGRDTARATVPRGTPEQPRYLLEYLRPDVRFTWNSAIPYSLNDGSMWAGRGANASVTAGLRGSIDLGDVAVDAVLAPTFSYSANRPFDIIPSNVPGRSLYSSPFHLTDISGSADLPLRFGDRPLRVLDGGESTIRVRYRDAMFALTTAHDWWGPAIRNTLVLSDNAPGIPRLVLGTSAPIDTRYGTFAALITSGTLTESAFFDTLASNDYQSFNAFRIAYNPPHAKNFTIGFARAIFTPQKTNTPRIGALSDLFKWRPVAIPETPYVADQIASVFARWVFPESGLEVYGEFARNQVSSSFADFFQTPYNHGAITYGLQWAIPQGRDRIWRLQSEVTDLAQNEVHADDPTQDFYAGRSAVKGYTQRGQVLGAAIGPGSSSEFIALDHLRPRWRAGVFVGRIRWEDNAMYRMFFPTYLKHDASILSGVRGGYRAPLTDVSLELTVARRFNYLFQNGSTNPLEQGTVRVQNVTFTARFTPRDDEHDRP